MEIANKCRKFLFWWHCWISYFNSWKNYFSLALLFSFYYISMKIYLFRYYINSFGPEIGLDYLFNSVFIILVNNFLSLLS